LKNLAGNNYRIHERKSSQFGRVGYADRQSGLDLSWKGKTMAYYEDMKRKDAYLTCRDRYLHDQLARPIINIIVAAIFSKPPDFQGDRKLVKRAQKVIRDSEVDWTTWGVDLEVFGDFFTEIFYGRNTKIASIPPASIDIDYDQKNILKINRYIQFKDEEPKPRNIAEEEMVHLKINNTTDIVYGMSTLRPVLWWLDVLDNLWERNALRAAQYYGYPLIAVMGIPFDQQSNVRTSLQADGQRPGRIWTFSEGVTVDAPDLTKNYPIHELIDRVYQYILASCGVPQHLVYESDSSRGVAMFSGDGFEMNIKAKRLVWSLGLKKIMHRIFRNEGMVKEGKNYDFRVSWAPVFMRDLKNLAAMVDIARGNKIASLQTSRELLGLDHSEEEERVDNEPEDILPAVPPKVAPTPKNKTSK